VQGPLWELSAIGALPPSETWRVIDVGAGLGTTSLGAAALAKRAGASRLEVVALERDPAALDVFQKLAERAASAGLIVPIRIDARRVDLEGLELARLPSADLVLIGLTLNELFTDREEADRLDALERVLRDLSLRLAPGGSLIALEPATRAITRQLMRLRDRFAADPEAPHVFAPCLRDAPCPLLDRERDWCHDQLPFALPDALADLAGESGLRRERLTYAYLTLRNDARRLWDLADRDPRALRVVGGPVESKGKAEWTGCSEPALISLRRLDRERAPANAALDGAARGTLLRLDRELPDRAALRARPDVPIERLFR
jgi:ribosomal protein RSM22 (predicted rRNA methylase)